MTDNKPSAEVLSIAKEAKKNGFTPFYITISGAEFVFRAVSRKEWREHIDERNKKLAELDDNDAVMAASIEEDMMEKLVYKLVLYPDCDKSTLPAGVVQTLSENILLKSGFGGADIDPVEL